MGTLALAYQVSAAAFTLPPCIMQRLAPGDLPLCAVIERIGLHVFEREVRPIEHREQSAPKGTKAKITTLSVLSRKMVPSVPPGQEGCPGKSDNVSHQN